MKEQSIFGLPVVVTDVVAEGEVLCGSFPPPERDGMTLDEYAKQAASSFTKVKLKEEVATWTSNTPPLDIAHLLRLKQEFKARHNDIPAGIKMSSLTLDLLTKDLTIIDAYADYLAATAKCVPPRFMGVPWTHKAMLVLHEIDQTQAATIKHLFGPQPDAP